MNDFPLRQWTPEQYAYRLKLAHSLYLQIPVRSPKIYRRLKALLTGLSDDKINLFLAQPWSRRLAILNDLGPFLDQAITIYAPA